MGDFYLENMGWTLEEKKAIALFQMAAIDRMELLKTLKLPNAEEIVKRMEGKR